MKPAATQQFGVFGSLEFRTNATAGLGEWQRFQQGEAANASSYAACERSLKDCPPQMRDWQKQLARWRALPARARLDAVNSYMNSHIRYADDRVISHVADRWQTLAMSLKGRGDCEDYALAKYETLKLLGFHESRLRIVVVNDTRKNIGHAVLSVNLDGGLYVLDNQNKRVFRHDSVGYYAPVYSVNATGRWINIATRQIRTQYVFAAEDGQDPAAQRVTPAVKKPVETVSLDTGSLLLRSSVYDDLLPATPPAADAPAEKQRAPILGTGAREP